jgi:peptide/nickel transport system substrate-binding protein
MQIWFDFMQLTEFSFLCLLDFNSSGNTIKEVGMVNCKRVVALLIAFLLCAGMAWAGGKAEATPSGATGGTATVAKAGQYSEAPMLAELVKAGKLPPVKDRLPTEPIVVKTRDSIGKYGGTAMVATSGTSTWDSQHFTGFVPLIRLNPTTQKLEPLVASSWEFSADAKQLTIHLRKGLKWSDGEPFTSEDVTFVYNNLFGDLRTRPTPRQNWPKAEAVDTNTVKLVFAESRPWFPYELAFAFGLQGEAYVAAHYMKQFHIDFNPKAGDLAKERGFQTWVELCQKEWDNQYPWENMDTPIPTLKPYSYVKGQVGVARIVRNPYFMKVDQAGNQLPYIDEIQVQLVDNVQTRNLKAMQGQFSVYFHDTNMDDYPLYKQNETKGDYKVVMLQFATGGDIVIYFDNNLKDPVIQPIISNKIFRQAFSMGIDRKEINEVAYGGLATPRQATALPGSRFIDASMETAFAQYDVAKANALLDGMGLSKKDADGFRLMNNGKRLTITFTYSNWLSYIGKVMELVKEQVKKIGVDIQLKLVDRNLQVQATELGQIEMTAWSQQVSADFLFASNDNPFVPLFSDWFAGPLWGRWFNTGGKEGVEPPQVVKDVHKSWQDLATSTNDAAVTKAGKAIFASQAENLWGIGLVGLTPKPVIVKNNIGNFPKSGVTAWDYLWMEGYDCETLYLK